MRSDEGKQLDNALIAAYGTYIKDDILIIRAKLAEFMLELLVEKLDKLK